MFSFISHVKQDYREVALNICQVALDIDKPMILLKSVSGHIGFGSTFLIAIDTLYKEPTAHVRN